jgi:hypothetical protein
MQPKPERNGKGKRAPNPYNLFQQAMHHLALEVINSGHLADLPGKNTEFALVNKVIGGAWTGGKCNQLNQEQWPQSCNELWAYAKYNVGMDIASCKHYAAAASKRQAEETALEERKRLRAESTKQAVKDAEVAALRAQHAKQLSMQADADAVMQACGDGSIPLAQPFSSVASQTSSQSLASLMTPVSHRILTSPAITERAPTSNQLNDVEMQPQQPQQPSQQQPSQQQPSQMPQMQPWQMQPSQLQPSQLQPSQLQPSQLQPSQLQPSQMQMQPQMQLQPSQMQLQPQPQMQQMHGVHPSLMYPPLMQPQHMQHQLGGPFGYQNQSASTAQDPSSRSNLALQLHLSQQLGRAQAEKQNARENEAAQQALLTTLLTNS